MAKKKTKPILIKCVVNVSQLRTEVLDDNCEIIVEDKADFNGAPYKATKEITYRKGDEVYLTKEKIKKLGKSVTVVMAPVELVPVTSETPDDPSEKDKSKTPTVAETIPKPEKT